MTPVSMSMVCLGERPTRRPRRTFLCTIDMQAPTPVSRWLLMPLHLDDPLVGATRIWSIDHIQTAAGVRHLRLHGSPGLVAFRVERGERLVISDWETTGLHLVDRIDVGFADEITLFDHGTLSSLLAGPLRPPDGAATGPALLARWTPPDRTDVAVVRLVRQTISLGACSR
jgi:hypothetical protein